MKKVLSLVMAMMMLMLCPAMAETAAEVQTLVSADGSYSIDVPANYTLMGDEAVAEMFATEEMQQQLVQMLGLEDPSQIDMFLDMLAANNMMIIFDESMVGNVNVQCAPVQLTMKQLEISKKQMDSNLKKQYVTMGVAEEDIETMDIQTIGERRWYGMKLVMTGIPVQLMITVADGVQYVLTFSMIPEEEMLPILESFKLTEE